MLLAGVVAGYGCAPSPDGRVRKSLRVTGTVVEQLHAPPYSYLRVRTDAGEVWAMVPTATVNLGELIQ